jgi:hypothetical protein
MRLISLFRSLIFSCAAPLLAKYKSKFPFVVLLIYDSHMLPVEVCYRLMSEQTNDDYEIAIKPRWNLEGLSATKCCFVFLAQLRSR